MTPSTTAAPGRLLKQVAAERQTGALMVNGRPGGAVYVHSGCVVYAESPAAPGVGELLTSSGRLAARTWQNALDLGTSTARVGRLLVEQGHLTQGELELCVLGATYDAAYFALASDTEAVDFRPGATHWLGPVVQIDPATVDKESRRRVRLLAEIHPDPRVDTAAVIPAARAPRERVALTAAQWELLVHADGQRTPADLALLLGRAGFATVQELRRLAAAGLIELPEVRPEAPEPVRLPRARGTAAPVRRPKIQLDDPPVPVTRGRPAPGPGADAVPEKSVTGPPGPEAVEQPPRHAEAASAEEGNATGTVYRAPRLARRKPGAKLPKDLATEPPPVHTGADEVLLTRIRSALRALR